MATGVGSTSKCPPNAKCGLFNEVLDDQSKLMARLVNIKPTTDEQKAALAVIFAPNKFPGLTAINIFNDPKLKKGFSGSAKQLATQTNFVAEAKELGKAISIGMAQLKLNADDFETIPALKELGKRGQLNYTTIGIAAFLSAKGTGVSMPKCLNSTFEADAYVTMDGSIDLSTMSRMHSSDNSIADRAIRLAAMASEVSAKYKGCSGQ